MLDLFSHFYTVILYQPVYNLVIALYNFSPGPNLGWAIVMLSIIVRLLFLPFTLKGYSTDKLLEATASEIHQLEKDPSLDSRQKRSQITSLLRSKGINPVSEIISLLGQMLFLLILFQIVQRGITPAGYDKLYSFVAAPHGDLNTTFFGNVVVSHPNFLYSIVAAGLLFIEQIWEYEVKKNIPEATFSERWYPLLLAAFTFIILIILPATKALFFIVSILFSMGIRLMFTLGRLGKKEENVR